MNQNDKARIKELYFKFPELSTKEVAKMLSLPMTDVRSFMQKLGYTPETHKKAKKAVAAGQKPKSPMKMAAKPKVEKKPVEIVPNCAYQISPETIERRREAELKRQANILLQKAEQAAQEGDIEKYVQYCKEHGIAARKAEAYHKRGQMDQKEREISTIESQYKICK